MPFEYAPAIASNTAKIDAVETVAILHPGTITKFEIEYPKGCAGLVHTEIYHWDVKLWPKNEEGTFTGDDIVIISRPNFELSEAPYELVIKTWNLDDTFQHTPRYRVEVNETQETIGNLIRKLLMAGR